MSGAIASSFPNRLFGDFQQLHANTEAQEIQNQFAPQKNALLMEQTRSQLADADTERVSRLSQWILTESGGDPAKMAMLYSQVVPEEQRQGRLLNAPAQFIGAEGLRRLASAGTSSEKQAEQRGVAGAVNAINLGNRPGATSTPGVTTSTTAGDIEVPAQERARLVYDGMIKRGADHATAAGWAANALHESSANPNTGPGDRGASEGLFMWTGPRLQAYIAKNGHSPRGAPLDEQLDFIMHELNTTEAPARAYLDRAAPEDKAAVISREFLRPKDREGEQQRRSATAQRLATLWGGQPGAPGGTRTQVASVTPTVATDATTAPQQPQQQPPAQQQPGQQQTATTTQPQQQPSQQQPAATLPPDLQTNEAGLTAKDLDVLVPLQKLAATGNRAAAMQFHEQIQQRQTANRTAQQQWLTHQDTLVQRAQTAQHQAQTLQISQQHLDLAKEANQRANQEAAAKAAAAGETFVPGTGIEAVHENTVQKYAAKMAKGEQLTDNEQRLYDGAYYALQQSGGQSGVQDDLNNPGVKIPYQTTRRLPPSLPEPKGGALPAVISQPSAPTKAPATLEQTKASTYAGRMQIAVPVMDELDDITTYKERGLETAGKYVGYNLNSPEYRRLRVAQEAFLSGVIRQDSGAAVDKSEWERYAHLYFPMPGESVETLKLKQRIRQAEMDSMIRAAGPGYKPPEPAKAQDIKPKDPDKAPANKPANRPPLSSFEG